MGALDHLLGTFRHEEPVWCCDRCRDAALTAAAERRGREAAKLARATARATLRSTRGSRVPHPSRVTVS